MARDDKDPCSSSLRTREWLWVHGVTPFLLSVGLVALPSLILSSEEGLGLLEDTCLATSDGRRYENRQLCLCATGGFSLLCFYWSISVTSALFLPGNKQKWFNTSLKVLTLVVCGLWGLIVSTSASEKSEVASNVPQLSPGMFKPSQSSSCVYFGPEADVFGGFCPVRNRFVYISPLIPLIHGEGAPPGAGPAPQCSAGASIPAFTNSAGSPFQVDWNSLHRLITFLRASLPVVVSSCGFRCNGITSEQLDACADAIEKLMCEFLLPRCDSNCQVRRPCYSSCKNMQEACRAPLTGLDGSFGSQLRPFLRNGTFGYVVELFAKSVGGDTEGLTDVANYALAAMIGCGSGAYSPSSTNSHFPDVFYCQVRSDPGSLQIPTASNFKNTTPRVLSTDNSSSYCVPSDEAGAGQPPPPLGNWSFPSGSCSGDPLLASAVTSTTTTQAQRTTQSVCMAVILLICILVIPVLHVLSQQQRLKPAGSDGVFAASGLLHDDLMRNRSGGTGTRSAAAYAAGGIFGGGGGTITNAIAHTQSHAHRAGDAGMHSSAVYELIRSLWREWSYYILWDVLCLSCMQMGICALAFFVAVHNNSLVWSLVFHLCTLFGFWSALRWPLHLGERLVALHYDALSPEKAGGAQLTWNKGASVWTNIQTLYGSIVRVYTKWFGITGQYYQFKLHLMELIECTVQSFNVFVQAPRVDSWQLLPSIVLISLNLMICPLLALSSDPRLHRDATLAVDSLLDVAFMAVTLAQDTAVTGAAAVAILFPMWFILARINTLSNVLCEARFHALNTLAATEMQTLAASAAVGDDGGNDEDGNGGGGDLREEASIVESIVSMAAEEEDEEEDTDEMALAGRGQGDYSVVVGRVPTSSMEHLVTTDISMTPEEKKQVESDKAHVALPPALPFGRAGASSVLHPGLHAMGAPEEDIAFTVTLQRQYTLSLHAISRQSAQQHEASVSRSHLRGHVPQLTRRMSLSRALNMAAGSQPRNSREEELQRMEKSLAQRNHSQERMPAVPVPRATGTDASAGGAVAAAPGNGQAHGHGRARSGSASRHKQLFVVLCVAAGVVLLASSVARLLAQQAACRDLVTRPLWDASSPQIYFADGFLSSTSCDFPSVTELNLAGTLGRVQSIPDQALVLYTQLTSLNVADNALTAVPFALATLTRLRSLYAPRNRISALPPYAVMSRLSTVQLLDLRDNAIDVIDPDVVEYWSSTAVATQLMLMGNPFAVELKWSNHSLTALPSRLVKLIGKTCASIDLSHNEFVVYPIDNEWLSAQRVDMAFNQLATQPPIGAVAVKVNLSHNFLNEDTLPDMSFLHLLEEVDVSFNVIRKAPPLLVGATQTLYLYGNPIVSAEMNDNTGYAGGIHLGTTVALNPALLQVASTLETLVWSEKEFKDTKRLPAWISQLTALQALSLSNAVNLRGLPTEIGLLPSLRTLDLLGHVGAELPSQIGLLSRLTRLEVVSSSRQFPTRMPSTVGQLTTLQTLRLRHLSYVTQLGFEFDQLTALTYLQVYGTSVQRLPASLTSARALKTLIFNPWTELGFECAGNLPNLTFVDVRRKRDDPSAQGNMSGIFSCPNVQRLYLEKTLLTELPTQLAQMTALRELSLGYNDLQTVNRDVVAALTSLRQLSLECNPSLHTLPNLTFAERPLSIHVSCDTLNISALPWREDAPSSGSGSAGTTVVDCHSDSCD